MTTFPRDPVSPRTFIEDVIPALFAEAPVDPRAESFDVKLGVRLEGADGGEWTLHFVAGELGIAEGRADDCALTIVQRVEDWRSALWDGHPRLVADLVERVWKGADGPLTALPDEGAPANPEALRELEKLVGRIDAIVEAEAGTGASDWRIGLHMGPGPVDDAPKATIQVGTAEAEALRRGELHPLEALITGQLRLEGDFGMIIQLQAIAMSASMPPPPR